MDGGRSVVTGKKTFAEKMKSREAQQFFVIVTFLFAPLLLLIVFTYLPFMRMVQFSFYNMKYTIFHFKVLNDSAINFALKRVNVVQKKEL